MKASILSLLVLLPVFLAKEWHGLSFDPENFMCVEWDEFCETILDDIDCAHDSTNRTITGCANYPEEQNMANWVGACSCSSPIAYVAGTDVTKQLISNRIKPDMSWIMEPWDSGPPYDVIRSYEIICNKVLNRLGCPKENQTISAQMELEQDGSGPIPGSNFKCTCGSMTTASSYVNTLMMDKMNDYNQRSTPIFSNPVYLSVPMSICIVLITGKIGAIIAVYLKLPPIIGFLLVGLGIQNILNPMFLKGAGYPYPSPASEIKLIALVIVLMRAGLAIKFDEIVTYAVGTTLFSIIPYMAEFFAFMYIGKTYFTDFSTISMGLFASIMAPLGPSVVISGLLNLMASPKRNPGYTGKQVLISTPIEAVLAIVLFGIFSNLEQTGIKNPLYPWIADLSLLENCLLIPANLLFSTVMGILVGALASKYIDWRSHQKTDFIWYRVNKNPQMGSSTADLVFVLIVLCYTMMSLCVNRYIQQSSGVLVVFVASITVSKMANPEIVADIAFGLKGIWVFAEIFLFTLTGTSLSFNSDNGPLYGQRGLSQALMRDVVAVLFCGTACRFIATGLCVLMMYSSMPPHRQRWQWLVPFWINIYIFSMAKATVQATLGSVAYYQKIIPGPSGLNQGQIIAQSTAFAVLIFAPLGALLTNYVGCPLALYTQRLDREAGWNEESRTYQKVEPSPDGHDLEGVELSDMSKGIKSDKEDEEEEEVVVGTHGERLHDPETIDATIRHARKLIRRMSYTSASQFRMNSGFSVTSHNSGANHSSVPNADLDSLSHGSPQTAHRFRLNSNHSVSSVQSVGYQRTSDPADEHTNTDGIAAAGAGRDSVNSADESHALTTTAAEPTHGNKDSGENV